MTVTNVQLNPRLSSAHHRVLLRYLVDELALSHHEWVTLADAVDALGESLVGVNGQIQTFRQFYQERIDQPLADSFLVQLCALTDVEAAGRRVQAAVAQEIGRKLDAASDFDRNDQGCRMLLVYCLYWWAAFARGYIFELIIFRDMEASGIAFVPHNILDRQERVGPYDFTLLGLRGDIKHTTYFLTAERLSQLSSDLFVTRWYLTSQRTWVRAAILRKSACDVFLLSDGCDSQPPVLLDEVSNQLPKTTLFLIDSITLAALGYDQWKDRVLLLQTTTTRR